MDLTPLRRAATVILIAPLLATASPQSPSPAPPAREVPTFGTTTELVYVRFHVEKKGTYLDALKPDQIRVLEDGQPQKIEGVDAVQSKLDFKLVAPDALAGLPRQNVRLVQHENNAGAVAVYGKGLGAIVVLQNKAGAKQNQQPLGGGGGGGDHSLRLPQVNINGATGTELATALGTVVTFERNGISYTVAGSVPPQAAEQAARELQ